MAKLLTNDGVELNYEITGSGPPLVLVTGWNQTAALFERQVEGLSDRFTVITFDLRGHGESERPDHGYRVSRYAMDLRTVIDEVAGGHAHVLGHSMGCCVLWCYFDLFAGDGIDRAVFVDMMTHPLANPAFTEEQVADYGSILSAEEFFGVFNGLDGGAAGQVVPALVESMVTDGISVEDKAWVLAENARMPGPLSAREFFSDILADWRDVREVAKTGRISGARHVPRGMLEFWIDPKSPYHKDFFAEDKTYVFYCAGAWRSALSAKTAQDMGLAPVAHLEGGITAWIEADGPIDPPREAK